MKESKVFVLTVFGDGDTMMCTPSVNILAEGVCKEAELIDISDCAKNVSKKSKKDAEHIAKLLSPHIERLDPEKN